MSGGLRFLVVDDHGLQRWLMENLLRAQGAAEVKVAADGRAALAILHAPGAAFDIVVSDLDMPGMDGLEFIRHLGEGRCGVALIVSSSLERAVISTVEKMAGEYGVRLLGGIQKPLTTAKLVPLLERFHQPMQKAPPRPGACSAAEMDEALRLGRLEPWLQPQVSISSGRVTGVEALARWRDPRRGIVSPRDFLPALEAGGLIDRLTESMLRRSLAACRAWRAGGLDAGVSVNISLASAVDLTLPARLVELVEAQGLQPRHLVLEVTESSAAPHLGRALENLARLRMRGFGLSIDDYGTGYSSMQQLGQFPFSELKIEGDFVRRAAHGPAERALLESSIEIAGKLGIVAVAEGVETQAEWDLLARLGCAVAQGYFVARPMAVGGFLDWNLSGNSQLAQG